MERPGHTGDRTRGRGRAPTAGRVRGIGRRPGRGAAPPGGRALPTALAVAVLLALACVPGRRTPDRAAASYHVYVANESSDVVSRVRFEPGAGATVEKSVSVGVLPGDLDGAHGVRVSPDGRYWYLTTAHGTPYGRLWKYRTGTDEPVASDTLGLFPATIGVTPDGSEAYVVNFNLHGDPEPSSVSVVQVSPGETLAETARIPVCVRPHGSRISADGRFHYSVCGPDDRLTEISTAERRVTRTLELPAAGEEGRCGPSWAEPSTDGRFVYVTCNAGRTVHEVATHGQELRVTRSFTTGPAPYNLEATPDGRLLLATNRGGASVSVIDLERGTERARIATTVDVTHGVVASPDGRYAFVSSEGVGSTRGTVDVLDLGALERVASVRVRHQAGGIDFWKIERPGPRPPPGPAPPGPGR